MPRKPSCECGDCPPCVRRAKHREYMREYNAKRDREKLNAYWRERRRMFPEQARERSRKASATRRAKIKAILTAAKDQPCVDCGVRLPPECMDLDHRDPSEKEFGPSKHRETYRTFAEIEAEIAKCDVRCPNCHRLRHHRERQEAA